MKHNGQAWKEIKRGEAALQTLPQLKLVRWALWSLYQIGRANSHLVILSCPKLVKFIGCAFKKGHGVYNRVSHFYTFFELSLVLLTTHAHGL